MWILISNCSASFIQKKSISILYIYKILIKDIIYYLIYQPNISLADYSNPTRAFNYLGFLSGIQVYSRELNAAQRLDRNLMNY